MNNNKAVIVGCGIAGLSSAIRLKVGGIDTNVYEMNSYPGGKLTAFSEQGYRFDMGPSLFTMPQFVEELFEIAGKNVHDHFDYKKKDIVCNYFFEDGTRFQAKADEEDFAKLAEETFDVSRNTILEYFKESKKSTT